MHADKSFHTAGKVVEVRRKLYFQAGNVHI